MKAFLIGILHRLGDRDYYAGRVGTTPRSREEMKEWRALPDPKMTYRQFVGLPEEEELLYHDKLMSPAVPKGQQTLNAHQRSETSETPQN